MSKRTVVQSTKESQMSKSNPNAAPKTAPAANGEKAKVTVTAPDATATAATSKKAKRAKVRLVSTTIQGLWVRAFVDVVEKYGFPLDPNGERMVPGKAPAFGLTAEQREARVAAKAAEKARFEAMSDEEKLAYAKQKREAKQAATAAKKAAERDQLIAQIKAEIQAGKL